jgi:uncharacterized protein YigE (DUF2233 family)
VKRGPVLAVLALLAACSQAPEPSQPQPAEELPGTPSACAEVLFEGSRLIDCVADPALHRIDMVLAGADGAVFQSFAAYSASRGADDAPVVFAVNGGMFDSDGQPIGYFVQAGERGQALNRNAGPGNFHMKPNGVFFGDAAGAWRVLDSETFYREITDRPQFGTQSGPILLVNGELHPDIAADGESLKVRNAVGVDGQGRAHFVLSAEAISFGRLARFYRDELGIADALFLDGQVSQLWDPASGRMDNGAAIGPIIVVEMR